MRYLSFRTNVFLPAHSFNALFVLTIIYLFIYFLLFIFALIWNVYFGFSLNTTVNANADVELIDFGN
jgi:hypothetical protein